MIGTNATLVCHAKALTLLVHIARGYVSSLKDVPDKFRRLGGQGSSRQRLGQQADDSGWEIKLYCKDKTEATKKLSQIESVQAFDCQITDQHGRVIKHASCDKVDITSFRKGRGPVTSTGKSTYLIEATLTFERQPDG